MVELDLVRRRPPCRSIQRASPDLGLIFQLKVVAGGWYDTRKCNNVGAERNKGRVEVD